MEDGKTVVEKERPLRTTTVLPKLCIILKLLCWARLLPYRWITEENEFEYATGQTYYRRNGLWIFTVLLGQIMHVGLFSWRMLQMIGQEDVAQDTNAGLKKIKLTKILALGAHVSFQTIICIMMICFVLDLRGISTLFNRILWMLREKSVGQTGRKDITITVAMPAFNIIRVGLTLINVMIFPKGLLSLYSFVPDWLQSPVTFAICLLFTAFNSCSWVAVTFIPSFPSLIFLVFTAVLKELPKHGSLREKVINIRKLHVLKNDFEAIFAKLCIPAMTIYGILAPIYAIFCTFRLFGRVRTGIIVGSQISLIFMTLLDYSIFAAGGRLNFFAKSQIRNVFIREEQEIIQRSSNSNHNLKLIRAYRKSCAHLTARVGWTGKIRRAQFLNMMSYIIVHSVKLLIVTSKSGH